MKLAPKRFHLLLAAAALAGSTCMAARPPKKPAVVGLDSLDDAAVGTELSSRGMVNLLDRYFKVNNTPEDQQQAIKALGALDDLKSPALTPAEKTRRVRAVVDGIDTMLPRLNDPMKMADTGQFVIDYGVSNRVVAMEYFGEDPVTQSQLKPMADAMHKLFAKSAATAREKADQLANIPFKGDNDPKAKQWESMNKLANEVAYTDAMDAYYRCLARPESDPDRKKIASAGVLALADYDNGDVGVQPRVRNMIGKLQAVGGQYKTAKKTFAGVLAQKDITPPPNPYELFEARYFNVITDLLAKDLPSAETDDQALSEWNAKSLPEELKKLSRPDSEIKETAKNNSAVLALLHWRVLLLKSEKASPGERGKIDDEAEAILLKLRETHPEWQSLIDEQLVKRMDPKKPIDDKMTSSILLALIRKARIESYKTEKVDQGVIAKGIEAIAMLQKRKGQAGVTPESLEDAAATKTVLLEKAGKRLEAAAANLDFAVDYYSVDPKKAPIALNYAGWLIFSIKKEAAASKTQLPDGFEELYNRFLPIAINPPFNHKDLAYSYAAQLQALGKHKEAIKFFKQVEPTDRLYAVAQYQEMIALSSMLSDSKMDAAERRNVVDELVKVAESVKAAGVNASEIPARLRAAIAATTLANAARVETHNPKLALSALDGLEDLVKGQAPATAAALINEGMTERVYAYMALGKFTEGVAILTKVLESSKGGDGIYLVGRMLGNLDKEYAAAELAHNPDQMRETAKNEADLTGYLVQWCDPAKQTKPEIAKLYYAYKVYDARTHHLAGSLAADTGERKRLLEDAQAQYKSLESPGMHALYVAQPTVAAQITSGKVDAADPDPNVATGLALTEFDLGNYQAAKDHLEPMLVAKGFGSPMIETNDPLTGPKLVANDIYWEAWYKFIKSDYEVNKGNAAETTKVGKILKNVLLQGNVPDRYADDFEQLRKDLIPDFNPNAAPTTAPATAPTVPTASAAVK